MVVTVWTDIKERIEEQPTSMTEESSEEFPFDHFQTMHVICHGIELSVCTSTRLVEASECYTCPDNVMTGESTLFMQACGGDWWEAQVA